VLPNADAEGRSDRVRGDIVMRRANAACGEDISVNRAQRVHRLDYATFFVWYDPHLAHGNAVRCKELGDGLRIDIARSSRKKFVSD